jgi:hypothetical protein
MKQELRIFCRYDPEIAVWYVVESDIPGLWLEGKTQAAFEAHLAEAAPELVDLNRHELGDKADWPIVIILEKALGQAA